MANGLPSFDQLAQSLQQPNAPQQYSNQLALLGSQGALKNLSGGSLVSKDIWGQTFRLFMGIQDSSTGVDEVQNTAAGYSQAVMAEPYVNRCITYRGNAIASIPLRVYQLDTEGKPIKAVDHDALRLLDETNPQDIDWISTVPQLMQYSLGSMDTHGHFAWQMATSKGGKPTEIYFLLPTQYELERSATQGWSGLKIARKAENSGGSSIKVIPRKNVVYVANFSLMDPLLGTSRIEVLRSMINLMLYAYESNKSYFKNSQRPDWVLTGQFANTEDNISRIRRTLRKWLTGENNRSPLILGDNAQAHLLTTATKDMEWLNQIRVGSEMISMCFGIPVPIVNNFERSTYENLQAARIAFWSDNFIPEVDGFTQKLTRAYLRKFWPETARQKLCFGYDYSKIEGISEDIERAWSRIKGMWEAIDNSVKTFQITPNESRVIKSELLSQAGLSNQMLKGTLKYGGDDFYASYMDTPLSQHSVQALIDVMAARGTNPQLIENVPGAPNAGDNAAKPPPQRPMANPTANPTVNPTGGQSQQPPAKSVDLDDISRLLDRKLANFRTQPSEPLVIKRPNPIPIRDNRLQKSQATLTRGLKRLFQDQKNDALRNLRAGDTTLWDEETYRQKLQDLIGQGILDAAAAAYEASAQEYNLPVAFDSNHSRIQGYIAKRTPLIHGIDQTTRKAIGDPSAESISAAFASAIDYRAGMIAQTETVQAYGIASLYSCADAGVQKAQMYDNPDDPEVDGRIVTLDEAEQLMAAEHPNGARCVAPAVSDFAAPVTMPAATAPNARALAPGIQWLA